MISIPLPDGISAQVEDNAIIIKGSLGTNSRTFNKVLLSIKIENNSIVIDNSKQRRIEKIASSAKIATAKQIRNDIAGVTNHFEKMMSITYAHFPMVVEVKGKELIIKNMLGERDIRHANIIGDTKVEIKDQSVRVYGTKLDDVGQTAANIRRSTKVKHKDIRIFQDGIYHAIAE